MVYLGFPLYKNALKSNKDKKKAKIEKYVESILNFL